MKGIVDKYFEERAFGFIETEGRRYFFSARSVIGGRVDQGDIVEFSSHDDPCHPGDVIAVSVKRIGTQAVEPGRLFVANLPLLCTADDIRQCFEQVGPVLKVNLAVDPETRESRGFGFVQMKNPKDALQAICDLHGQTWGDRAISVKQGRRRTQSGLSRIPPTAFR